MSASSPSPPRCGSVAPDRALQPTSDGTATGYPDGLAGEEIPLGARVVAVCDVFDAIDNRPALTRRGP